MSPILDTPISVDNDGGLTCSLWVSPEDLSEECVGDADEDLVTWATQFASDTLYLFSGRAWPGICTDVVRPCRGPVDANPGPVRLDRSRRWGCCTCGLDGSFGCCPVDQVRLPAEPVVAITQVRLDGVVLDPSDYRLDPPGWLVRLEPHGRGWPCCQDRHLPATEEHTFEVAYTFGRAIPSAATGGSGLAALLACELIAARGGGECRLPKRVTSVVRQGITYAILDPLTLFAEGRTGISEIDLWLGAVNPHGVKTPARIWTPSASARAHRPG